MTDDPQLAAEQRARVEIDRQLTAAGWSVVDRKDLNPFVPSAVREVIMAPGHGRADYALSGPGMPPAGKRRSGSIRICRGAHRGGCDHLERPESTFCRAVA